MNTTFRTFYGIDWAHCARAVSRLQGAIAKAREAGDLRGVHALQDKLVRTFEARALAVKRVRNHRGGTVPGVDGVVWAGNAALLGAIGGLRDLSKYHPMPVKRMYPVKAKGRRPLSVPTMHDRAVQALFACALMPVAEGTADPRSYAYRPFKSAHDAAIYLRLVLATPYAKRWVLEAQVETLFESLSPTWLLQNIPMRGDILEKFLKAGFLESPTRGLHGTPTGLLQGGAISPILANMALDGLEAALGDGFRRVRYGDGLVVAGKSPEDLTSRALPRVQAFLAVRGLRLAHHKTKITAVEDGFDFVGFTFREYADPRRAVGYKKGIFLTTPAKAHVQKLKKRVKRTLKSLRRGGSAATVIVRLNPMLRAWAQYYKPFNSKEAFGALASYVWEVLWRWCRKQRPAMARRALRRAYFKRVGGNAWVFYARNLEGRTITLVSLGYVKIERHPLCKHLNPFVPEHEAYYRRRLTWGAFRSVLLSPSRSTLLKKQRGICPVCHGALLRGERLEVHHIRPRARGGKDTWSNLLLLHQFCHKHVTYSKSPRLKAAWRKAGIVDEGDLPRVLEGASRP